MKKTYGEMEIDGIRLKAADPDGLYLFMLEQYPYMMIPTTWRLSPARRARRFANC